MVGKAAALYMLWAGYCSEYFGNINLVLRVTTEVNTTIVPILKTRKLQD